jgi:hypothetical protein
MLKLAQLMLREEGPQHSASDVDRWIRIAASGYPHLTIEQFINGERDAHGHVKPTGYTGWFWFLGRGSSPACVSRVCLEMQCSPSTPLVSLLGIQG